MSRGPLAGLALALMAASGPVLADPVVQPLPTMTPSYLLNEALGRLARNPRDVEALLDAGKYSLTMGDTAAAIGFYQRADALSPNNSRVKAGLAGAFVQSEDPLSAITLFDEAAKAGTMDAARVSERGLAYDLVGDNVSAQRFYHEALIAGPDAETSRRMALSQAIAGDRRGMEVTLAPLLQRQDKAAWRTRAFALAILGDTEEAEGIARSTLPAEMAGAISGYLRFMPRLTPAQQAAAANLGRFPRAAEIGQDDPRFAAYARPRTVVAALDKTLTPSGEALGTKKGKGKDKDGGKKGKEQALASAAPTKANPAKPAAAKPAAPPPIAPPDLQPRRETTETPITLAAATPPAAAKPVPAPTQPPPAEVAKPAPVVAPPANPQPAPGFAALELPAPAQPKAAEAKVVVAKPVSVPPAKPRSLAEVFADLSPPSREAEPVAGAVDIRKVKAARPAGDAATDKAKDAKDAKDSKDKACLDLTPEPKGKTAKKGKAAANAKSAKDTSAQCKVSKASGPAHASRIWVQLATGKDRKGLAYDFARLAKADPDVFKGRKGFTSAWGQTSRLLTGPFESEAAANAFIAKLKKAGVGGAFLWTSPAGQVVDALGGK